MIYRGKFCDLQIEPYYMKSTGRQWRYAIIDKSGTLLEAQTGYESKNAARSVGRKLWHDKEDDLKREYVSHLTLVED